MMNDRQYEENICISFIQTYGPPMLVEENLDQNPAKKQWRI
jgi:hypothetical protein